jgi:hypothetical protein
MEIPNALTRNLGKGVTPLGAGIACDQASVRS